MGVFRLKGQPKRDGSIIVRSCKASQSPVYPIRDAILAVNHASCPSLSSSGPRQWGETGKPLRRLKTNSLPIRPDGLTDEQARSIQAERSRAAHEVHRHVREKQQAEAAEKAKAEAEAQAAARVQAEEAEAASRRWVHFVVSGSKARAGKVKAHCGALVDVQDRGDSYAVGPYEFREFEELGLYMCGRCQPEADRRFTVVFG